MSKKANRDKEIRELRAENRRLRAKNAYLCDELRTLKNDALLREKRDRLFLRSAASRAMLFSKKGFLFFLIGSFKLKSLFSIYRRLVYVVRRYTFITTTLKIFTFIFGVLQSSAIIVLFTGTMAITLPLTLIFSYTAIVLSFIFRKRLTKRVRAMLGDKNVTVFFPPRGRAFEKNSFFSHMVHDSVKDKDSLAVIVSPYAVCAVGILKKRTPFLALRLESQRIIIMRSHYFFTFKKKILSEHNKNITFIF